MLLIETAKPKKIAYRRAPRNVFCVIDNAHRSAEIAEQAVNGIFTNAGLTFDLGRKINWLENPLPADEEWQIEWFKFYFGLDMSHAFNQTSDGRYLQIWEYLTWSFIKQVPIGFDTPDVAARRVQNWIYAWQQFAKSPFFRGLGGGLETDLVRSIKRQIAFIKENVTAERNHRTLELYAIFIAAIALPEIDENGKLLLFAVENLHENLLTDIQTDGVQREQSSDYHLIVLRSFLGVKKNAQIFNLQLPEGFDERLLKACEFAMHIHRPDGEIPALSDGDTGSYLDLLKLAGELFSRQDFRYVATRGKEGRPPIDRNVSFTESGYFIQRSGWGESETDFEDERFLVFDCGHIGDGGHGHYDLLNAEIAAYGKPLVVDIGRYTYSEEGSINWRHFFKGTKAHNTVCVDEKDQTEYQRGKPKRNFAEGKFIERIKLADLDILSGKAISPLYDAIHIRRIFLVKNEYWLIWDELKSESSHRYDLRFHLTPDSWNHCILAQTDRNKIIQTRDVALVFESSKNPIVEPSWYSPEYGVKYRIPCVSVVESNVASTNFFTIIKPINAFETAPSFEVISANGNTKIEVCNQQGKIKDRLTWHIAGDKFTSVNLEKSEVRT
jgi:hypothetical protein